MTLPALKSRFLAAVGYVLSADESSDEAFAALLASNPDAFPVPRSGESLYDACAEVVAHSEAA
jgi:hypothetical protein